MALIAWASFVLVLVCVVAAVVAGRANALLVLASVFVGVFWWASGALAEWVRKE